MRTVRRHISTWEDDGFIGYECYGDDPKEQALEGVIDGNTSDICPHCGQTIKAIWDVRLEDVEDPCEP